MHKNAVPIVLPCTMQGQHELRPLLRKHNNNVF